MRENEGKENERDWKIRKASENTEKREKKGKINGK